MKIERLPQWTIGKKILKSLCEYIRAGNMLHKRKTQPNNKGNVNDMAISNDAFFFRP